MYSANSTRKAWEFDGMRSDYGTPLKGTTVVQIDGSRIRNNIHAKSGHHVEPFMVHDSRGIFHRVFHVDFIGMTAVRQERTWAFRAGIVAMDRAVVYGGSLKDMRGYSLEEYPPPRETTSPQAPIMFMEGGYVKHIHMNLHELKRNRTRAPHEQEPCVVVKYKGISYYGFTALCFDGGALRYAEKPILGCGARAVLSTYSPVTLLGDPSRSARA